VLLMKQFTIMPESRKGITVAVYHTHTDTHRHTHTHTQLHIVWGYLMYNVVLDTTELISNTVETH
jgi:hypothetical protein